MFSMYYLGQWTNGLEAKTIALMIPKNHVGQRDIGFNHLALAKKGISLTSA